MSSFNVDQVAKIKARCVETKESISIGIMNCPCEIDCLSLCEDIAVLIGMLEFERELRRADLKIMDAQANLIKDIEEELKETVTETEAWMKGGASDER
jgi:hypothetical protein